MGHHKSRSKDRVMTANGSAGTGVLGSISSSFANDRIAN
jgi:hypothetical protein